MNICSSKRFIIQIILMLYCWNTSLAQSHIKGIAMEQNSGHKYISNVRITCPNAVPTTSDVAGAFVLEFPQKTWGMPIWGIEIYKKDMEVINVMELQDWVTSKDRVYRIVLCPKGKLADARRQYYNIGLQNYEQKYLANKKKIEDERQSSKKTEQEYKQILDQLTAQYEKEKQMLWHYADQFARINKDDLNDMEKQAMEYLDNGEIDKAIEVYESARILEIAEEKLQTRDSLACQVRKLHHAIQRQIDIYRTDGSCMSMVKADSLQRVLTLHPEWKDK